jgi:hypothetical protein
MRWPLFGVTALGATYYLLMGYINPVVAGWPMTVDSAAEEALSWLSAEQKSEFRAKSKDQLYEYHSALVWRSVTASVYGTTIGLCFNQLATHDATRTTHQA